MSEQRATLLIVDDDAWFSDTLTASLDSYVVIRTPDPDEVFDLIERHHPDLIIADVMLGARNVFALLQEMQSYLDTRDIPIVILSALAGQIDLDDVKQLGIQAVLDKAEITPETLVDCINDVIRSKKGLAP